MTRVRALHRLRAFALICAVGFLASTVTLPAATTSTGAAGGPAILSTVLKDESDASRKGNTWFQALHRVVDRIRKPATVALGAIVPLTLLVGGGLLAVGIQRGMRLIGLALGASALVLLGNGLAA